MKMKKILIIGCPGGGKSSFARELHKRTSLPLCHLDMLFWNADKTTVTREILCERVREVLSGDEWIIDGNYSATLPMRLEACDTVFFLDMPSEICLRGVEQRRGKLRPDMPWIETEEDPEFTEYIKGFRETKRDMLLELIRSYPNRKLTIFQSHKEVDDYLTRLDIRNELFAMHDEKYRRFSSSLIPTRSPEDFIGVRIPLLRKYAKQLVRDGRASAFIAEVCHEYIDEDHLHAFILEQIPDFDTCLCEIERFLPQIDNWSTCDSLRPKALAKDKCAFLKKIREWLASPHEYTVRFAIEALMVYFLGDDFEPNIHDLVAEVKREEYYVKMMIAWYFATALAKHWEETLPYVSAANLGEWVFAKTVQKACESYRITAEQKQYLKSVKDKVIITERLVLDVIADRSESDLTAIFRHDKVKATYMLPDLDDESAHALFERIRDLSHKSDRYVRGIYLDGRLIGLINDTEIDGKIIEMGYALHPEHHSRGYMSEAFSAMIDYLFSRGFDEVTAGAFEENAASIRVMQKCGMVRLEKTDEIDYRGKTHKCIYFSIKSNKS